MLLRSISTTERKASLCPGDHVQLTLLEYVYRWPPGTTFSGVVTNDINEKIMGVVFDEKILLAKVRPESSTTLKLSTDCECSGHLSLIVPASEIHLIQLLRRLPYG